MSSPALFSGCPFSLSEGFPPQPCGAYSNTRNVPTLRLPSFVPRGILPIRGPQAPLCLVVAGGVCQGEGESKHPLLDCVFGDFLRIQKVTPRRVPPHQGRCGHRPLRVRGHSAPNGAPPKPSTAGSVGRGDAAEGTSSCARAGTSVPQLAATMSRFAASATRSLLTAPRKMPRRLRRRLFFRLRGSLCRCSRPLSASPLFSFRVGLQYILDK